MGALVLRGPNYNKTQKIVVAGHQCQAHELGGGLQESIGKVAVRQMAVAAQPARSGG